MASKASIAIRRHDAIQRFQQMGARLGAPIDMPMSGRDPDLLHALQLEAVAKWVQNTFNIPAEVAPVETEPVDTESVAYEAMKFNQLRDIAKERGISVPVGMTKAALVTLLSES